jgi:histidinol-phosphate aminotransferase
MSWEEKVRRVTPYVAGEQPKDKTVIKLNTNECPYPPSPGVSVAARMLSEESERLRLYPDMDCTLLVEELARAYGVDPEQVFVGVGSDDVLALAFLTYFTSGRKILFPDITYSFYDVWADLFRIPYEKVPLREDFSIDPENYLPGSGSFPLTEEPGGIIFANPTAPTGLALPVPAIDRIAAANPGCVVIVDEAYVDFGAQSAISLLPQYDNLLIVQTFSKSRAMAGMRIGFAIGSRKLIRYLKDVKFSFNSYTMNLPSIVLGREAVRDEDYFRSITGRIMATREKFKKDLLEMGFVFPDSSTNFVFARHPGMPAKELFAKLREKKIIVRHFDKPRISEYLRITIGTEEQMAKVTEALHEILGR